MTWCLVKHINNFILLYWNRCKKTYVRGDHFSPRVTRILVLLFSHLMLKDEHRELCWTSAVPKYNATCILRCWNRANRRNYTELSE